MDERMVQMPDGAALHVGVHGSGPDVLVLSGGPGCVNYLRDEGLAPAKTRSWFPEPRGVGRSGGGPHDMAQALADLEEIRVAGGVDEWLVLGHSWGSDLAVRYALDFPGAVSGVVGIAGHGPHKDRTWSEIYERDKLTEPVVEIEWDEGVWGALQDSFVEWIHEPHLFRKLADCNVPMRFVAAGRDIRPSWPLQQLAELVPRGQFSVVDGVPHDFWSTAPQVWRELVSDLVSGSR